MAMTVDYSERGQLLLVLATFIALTIISSVVLLNAFYAPADIGATTERRGLSEADTRTTEVSGHLQELYLKSTAIDGEPVPVLNRPGDRTNLDDNVDLYEETYLNVSSKYQSGVVNVTWDQDASTTEGFVLRQNNSDNMTRDGSSSGVAWNVVESPSGDSVAVPYVYLKVTAVDSSPGDPFVLHANSPSAGATGGAEYNLSIVENGSDGADVLVDGTQVCREKLEVPFEVELTNKGTFVRNSTNTRTGSDQGKRCGNVTSTNYGSLDVDQLYIAPGTDPVKGNYSVVATGSDAEYSGSYDDSDPGRRIIEGPTIIINPHFRIRYVAPGVRYKANVTALGGEV